MVINYIINLYFNLFNILNFLLIILYFKFITNCVNKAVKDFYN